MNEIKIETVTEDSAGKVLGQRISAPTSYCPEILVRVPRIENREQYNITNSDFVGVDTWNAYEISVLMDNGFPLTFYGKIVYPSNSPNIVESKSLKLYLNSLNMVKMGSNIDLIKQKLSDTIKKDLSSILEIESDKINIGLFHDDGCGYSNPIDNQHLYNNLTQYIIDSNIFEDGFSSYQENPALLQPTSNKEMRVYASNIRSNCRVTHQPDWATAYIYMEGESTPSYDSLARYLISFRNESHFHEECCEMIYKRLKDAFNPSELSVVMLYTRRGGISISPQRSSSWYLISESLSNHNVLAQKTIFE